MNASKTGDSAVTRDYASRTRNVIVDDALDPLFWKAQRIGPASAWWSHLPFAHWLVAACAPRLIVELGMHTGASHAAFCEAVQHTNCGARIFLFGPWHGDTHSNSDSEDYFKELQRFNNENYKDFALLIESDLVDAITYFSDSTIDILHIDRLQDFIEIRQDFASWVRKLSPRAVILVHNTNANLGDAAIAEFFDELAQRFPTFKFLHGSGLGVVAVGSEAPAAVLDLCQLAAPAEIATIQDRFAFLGNRWLVTAREASAAADLECKLNKLREDCLEQEATAAESRPRINQLASDLAMKTAMAEAAEIALDRTRQALASARSEVSEKATEIERLNLSLAIAERKATKAIGERSAIERMRQFAVVRSSELRRALDAVGMETASARNMVSDVAHRYTLAVNRQRVSRLSDLRAGIVQSITNFAQHRFAPRQSEDIDLLTSSIYFDARWYLDKYPDVQDQGMHPARHYLRHGGNENRDPGPWFSTGQYLRNNPDVAAAGVNALLHFLRYGQEEGRTDKVLPVVSLPRAQPVTELGPKRGISCIFITGEPESAGHRYRVLDLIEAATANQISARSVRADDLANSHVELGKHDIAVFWRVAWTEEVGAAIAHLRECGRRIIFDVDDLMTEPNLATLNTIDGIRTQSLTEDIVRTHYARVRRTMTECDACFTTTEELAFHLRNAGKTTFVIANGFDRAAQELSRLAVRQIGRAHV